MNHPHVDILSVISMPDEDLPITTLNHTGHTVTLHLLFVLGALSDVAECNIPRQNSSTCNSKCVLCMHISFKIVFEWFFPIILVRFRRPCHYICKICLDDHVLTLLSTRLSH